MLDVVIKILPKNFSFFFFHFHSNLNQPEKQENERRIIIFSFSDGWLLADRLVNIIKTSHCTIKQCNSIQNKKVFYKLK